MSSSITLSSSRVGLRPARELVCDQAKFHYAIRVADLRVRVVCVLQAGRKLVESQLRTGLQPGSSYLLRQVGNQVCDQLAS